MKKGIVLRFSIFLLYFLLLLGITQSLYPVDMSQFTKNDFPNSNANEIIVLTPENTTYSEPMSGYYLASYGFENDKDGSVPKGWVDESNGGGCLVDVKGQHDGHNKVLQLYDPDSSTSYSQGACDLVPQIKGYLEFWFYKQSGSTACYIGLHEGDSIKVGIQADADNDGMWSWRYSSGWTIVPGAYYNDNEWIHIKFDFNCALGKANFTINNDMVLLNTDMNAGSGYIDRIKVWTNSFRSGIFCIDAIGWSGDNYYSTGDNLNEGLLLSFENSTTLDWIGYSLDRLANKTIMGNVTIPIPSKGQHNIQVFGNNTLGTMYASNMIYFTIGISISILTPDNITYTESMSGYYLASYGFENDKDGSVPKGWIDESSGGGCLVDVKSQHDGHNKVLQLYDPDSSTAFSQGACDLVPQTKGYLEFWFYKQSGSTACYIGLHEGDSIKVGIQADADNDGMWSWRYSSGWTIVPGAYYNDNEWIHIKFDFNCALGKANFTINNDMVLLNTDMNAGSGYIDRIKVWTNSFRSGIFCIDAIGWSGDNYYSTGDNLNEGLLLSSENSTTLDWIGYSLDGSANKTIMGNVTIPIPTEGQHNIQVFGNDTLGTNYKSIKRYFSINVLPPVIFINSPKSNDILGLGAPDFEILVIDINLNQTWYSLDNGVNKYYFTGLIGSINQTEWDNQLDGPVSIRFYANDTLGRESSEEVIVIKDTTAPLITINSPVMNDFFNENPPTFNIDITDYSLNASWYTMDSGNNNVTFTGSTGIINQTEWDKLGEGLILIRFYANDSFGRLSYEDVTINKDITDPVIIIYSPLIGNEFTTIPPAFNISVVEANLDVVWYTIDGGVNNYYITQYTGYINSDAWNSAPSGAITIRFYALDEAGNIVFEEVIIQKSIPPYIPPDFSIIIIISVAIGVFIAAMSIVLALFLIRKRRARPPKPPKAPKPPKPPKPQRPSKSDLRRALKQEEEKKYQKIPPTTPVIVQREVIIIEKKPTEKEEFAKPIKCLYCGFMIDADARICPKCGNEQK
ncbi:MAG: zinc ribbon domain-containing protein [Promethearchaeota archaeon]